MKEEIKFTVIRVPESLYEKIKELAEKEKRSINSQMLILLEQGINEISGGNKK